MRIVIVEDEIKIREGMAKLIESQTEHVVLGEAVDGKDGLEMILRFRPDLVITDIKMPKMDGLEMVRELHERKLSLHVVILTGYSEFEYAQKALRYGVDDYLLKPLAIDDIRDMLAKVEEKLKEALAGGEAIVMTDIPNGTPFNCVSRLMEHYRFRHLTGMNLPMVVDVVSQLGEDASAEQLCEGTLKPSREAMIDVNAWMKELGILE